MEYNKVLAAFLNVEEKSLKKLDENIFEDELETQFYIFDCEEVEEYITSELFSDELNNATNELQKTTRYDLYSDCFVVDEDALYDWCLENLEEILYTEKRESFEFNGKNYIILKVNG